MPTPATALVRSWIARYDDIRAIEQLRMIEREERETIAGMFSRPIAG